MPHLITPSYEILSYPEDALERIERAARTCYKSEDKITPTSARRFVKTLLRRGHMAMIEFGGDIVVRFISNRGFTHEMVRHRMASYAQESTRYCNYGMADAITCTVLPMDWLGQDDLETQEIMGEAIENSWTVAQQTYMTLVRNGVKPEIAREVLPIGLKAEIVVKANVRQWLHIFGQRCSPKAHPRMRELMVPLRRELQGLVPVVFDGELL